MGENSIVELCLKVTVSFTGLNNLEAVGRIDCNGPSYLGMTAHMRVVLVGEASVDSLLAAKGSKAWCVKTVPHINTPP